MNDIKSKITYQKLFWLFMLGSVFGVLLEGFFCLFRYGAWETHVVSVWGPFCIIYGLGASGLYAGSVLMQRKNIAVKFLVFAFIATLIEYICGAVLKYGIFMKAWDYEGKFLNIDGIICLQMSVIWGLLGIVFSKYAVSYIEKIFEKMKGKFWKISCVCLSIFMVINLTITATVILRWSERHFGISPTTEIEMKIDKIYDDEYMQNRFVEWRFINDSTDVTNNIK